MFNTLNRISKKFNPKACAHKKRLAGLVVAILFIGIFCTVSIAQSPRQVSKGERGVWSLISYNYPDHYVRHQNYQGKITRILSPLDQADASFYVGQGYGGRESVAFEAINFPQHYLRHQNFDLKLHRYTNTSLYRQDITFYERPALAGGNGFSYESFNYPGYFLRHQNYMMKLQQNDGSELFRQDASFHVVRGLAGSPEVPRRRGRR